jgi:hypothetical protein
MTGASDSLISLMTARSDKTRILAPIHVAGRVSRTISNDPTAGPLTSMNRGNRRKAGRFYRKATRTVNALLREIAGNDSPHCFVQAACGKR